MVRRKVVLAVVAVAGVLGFAIGATADEDALTPYGELPSVELGPDAFIALSAASDGTPEAYIGVQEYQKLLAHGAANGLGPMHVIEGGVRFEGVMGGSSGVQSCRERTDGCLTWRAIRAVPAREAGPEVLRNVVYLGEPSD